MNKFIENASLQIYLQQRDIGSDIETACIKTDRMMKFARQLLQTGMSDFARYFHHRKVLQNWQ